MAAPASLLAPPRRQTFARQPEAALIRAAIERLLAVALIGRHEELRIGLADASVAVVAAAARTTRLLTLDERPFRPVRPLWGEAFQLLPADEA